LVSFCVLSLTATIPCVASVPSFTDVFVSGTDGYHTPSKGLIDGIEYDGHRPNAYLEKFAIGLKGNQKVTGGKVSGD